MSQEIMLSTLQSVQQLTKSDILSESTAVALISEAAQITEQKKSIEAEDKIIKDQLKEMFADEIEAEQVVSIFDWDSGMKLSLTPRGGSVEIDDFELMKAIYAHYGEQLGDRDGKAWQAFCAVTDPVECPRTINPQKLEAALGANSVAANARHAAATPEITEDMVRAATVVKKPTYAASCSAISKADAAGHESGDISGHLLIKERN